jgi:hypothetical protein
MRTVVAIFLCCACFTASAQLNAELKPNAPNSLERTMQLPRVLPSEAVPFHFVLVYDERGNNVMSSDASGISKEDLDQLDPGNYLVVAMDDHGLEVDREQLAILRY